MTMMILALTLAGAQVPPAVYVDAPRTNSAGRTLAQFEEARRGRMMRRDTDRDGRISAAEWQKREGADPAHAQRGFARIDTNGDGFVDAAEIDAMTARRFARLDADGDGRLTGSERPKARKAAHAAADAPAAQD